MVKPIEQRGAPPAAQTPEQQPQAKAKDIPILRTKGVRQRATKESMKAAAKAEKVPIKPELTQELKAEQLYFERHFLVEQQNGFLDRVSSVLTIDGVLEFLEVAIDEGMIDVSDVSAEMEELRARKEKIKGYKRWEKTSPFIGKNVFEKLVDKKISFAGEGDTVIEDSLVNWLYSCAIKKQIEKDIANKKGTQKAEGQKTGAGSELLEARMTANMLLFVSSLESYKQSANEVANLESGENGELIAAYEESFGGEYQEYRTKRRAVIRGISRGEKGKSPLSVMEPNQIAGRFNLPEQAGSRIVTSVQNMMAYHTGKKPELGTIKLRNDWKKSVDEETVAAYVKYQAELRDLWKQLHHGVIVETPYVKEVIQQAMEALKKDPPGLVYFHGDHGTGKTALAKHIAKKLLTELGRQDDAPMILSANKFLEPDKFTDDFRLQKLGTAEFLNQVCKEVFGKDPGYTDQKNSAAELMDIMASTRGELRDQIFRNHLREDYRAKVRMGEKLNVSEEAYCQDQNNIDGLPQYYRASVESSVDTLFTNPVQGKYMLGAMYHCMKHGLPLIIDEANAMTPEVAIAFNDLYTKKIREEIHTRTGESFTVKPGFCIMWTGNTGERFSQARYQMDAAAYSRIIPIKYNYLPQSTALSSSATLSERLANIPKLSALDLTPAEIAQSRELAQKDQIFQVLLVKLLNSRQGAELLAKKDQSTNNFDRLAVIKDLMNMSRAARIIMCLFTKEKVDGLNLELSGILSGGANDQSAYHTALNVANLTMRELLDKILTRYVDSGMALDIEYHLWQFIRDYDEHPKAQAVMYRIMQQNGFFVPGAPGKPGWPSDYSSESAFVKSLTEFKPLTTLPKYIRMEENGAYYALSNPDDYRLTYIPSLEIMQMIYGYLPERKESAYEALRGTEAWKASEKRKMEGDKELILMNTLRQKLARVENKWAEFYENNDWTRYERMTSAQSKQLFDELFVSFSASKIYDENWTDPEKNPNDVTMKEFMDEINKVIQHLSKRFVEFGMTTAEEAAKAAAGGAESQIDLVLSKLEE